MDQIVTAAVAYRIDGEAHWPALSLSSAAFDEVLQVAMEQRLLGTVAQAVTDGLWSVPADQFDRLAECHAAAQGHMLSLERELLRAAEALDAAGIEFRVLKGLALAHLVYDDPAWRNAADIDLLVPSSQIDAAVTVILDRLGAEQPIPELRPGFDREFGKEALLRVGPIELDVHRTFVTGPFGLTIELDDLFADSSGFVVGGRTLRTLDDDHLFLHACYGVALGDHPVRMGAVRDLLLCHRRLQVDLDRVLMIARRWRGEAVVRRAGQLVVEIVGSKSAGDLGRLATISTPRRQHWLLQSYLTPARSYSRPLASLVVIRGLRPRLRYARALLAPSRAYLQSRGWTGGSHARRALGRLVGHD